MEKSIDAENTKVYHKQRHLMALKTKPKKKK